MIKKGEQEQHDLVSLMDEKNIDKAIPGGKYGCAMLLKFHYAKSFSSISLGKLVALVKKSIQDQVFCHYKTLIYPNSNFHPKKVDKALELQIKRKIVDLVRSSGGMEGISLSQLPILYQEKYQERL